MLRITTCFVTGTLIHAKDGLRAIEQIRVGDYVLSRSESGTGSASYKRVVNTSEHLEKPVWWLALKRRGSGAKLEYLYVTPDHLFRVKGLNYFDRDEEFAGWVRADDLLYEYAERSAFAVFELPNDDSAVFADIAAILKTANPSLGLAYSRDAFDDARGVGIDFSKPYPQPLYREDGQFKSIEMDLPEDEDGSDDDGSTETDLGRYHPVRRTVHDLEVEENHTYFVGHAGILVRDASGP
jgi:hypothetical protein